MSNLHNKMVVLLNGPPRSGKDTIKNALVEKFKGSDVVTIFPMEMKTALYVRAKTFLIKHGYEFAQACQIIDVDARDETKKEQPIGYGEFADVSPRKILIRISEGEIKPKEGASYFGERALELIAKTKGDGICLFSDGGFQEEVDTFMGANLPTVVIRMFRDGCSFEGDSRDYVSGHFTYGITNNGEIEEAVASTAHCIAHAADLIATMMGEDD